jgi:hypothetical protein
VLVIQFVEEEHLQQMSLSSPSEQPSFNWYVYHVNTQQMMLGHCMCTNMYGIRQVMYAANMIFGQIMYLYYVSVLCIRTGCVCMRAFMHSAHCTFSRDFGYAWGLPTVV